LEIWKKWAIILFELLLFFIVFMFILVNPNSASYYFTNIGCFMTIAVLFSLFLIGAWLGRGRKVMTPEEQKAHDEETAGLLERQRLREEVAMKEDFERRLAKDQEKPKQV
jgi:hypothetical protein